MAEFSPDIDRGASADLARRRGDARVLVHHPGTNHLAYELVAGLQEGGYACDFHTGFFYAPTGLAARAVSRLPDKARARVERELRRRAHAGVDPDRVFLRAWPEIAHVALGRIGVGQNRLARVIGWRNDLLDAAVARVVRQEKPRVVIGHDGSALHAGRAAHEVGAAAILNQVVGHVAAAHDIFRDEAVLAPEFAETMVTTPDWIVERHEAEIREADGIMVPSDYVRDTLTARAAAPEKIVVLPYGVDVERFHPACRRGARGSESCSSDI